MPVANTDIFFALKVVKSRGKQKKGSAKMIKEKRGGYYESEYSGGLLAVRIKGEIDHHSAVEMRGGIDGEIRERRPLKLILDLSAVDFMDSSGLGLILGRYSAIKEVGGELLVLNPNEGVMKILKLAGAERIIRIETVDVEAERQKQNKNTLKGRKIR
jgi:stage II sporulation protein AA (anti-sigma F factor antagonist)